MSFKHILLEQKEPGIYLLTINRLQALNALNSETLTEIGAALSEIGKEAAARVLLVTGAGDRAFVAGADVRVMRDFTPLEAQALSEQALRVFRKLEALSVPAIALVNGYCLGGGCEFALSCDFILAAENAVFGQPEVNLGIMAGWGGTQRLTRLIGRARAMELLVSGRQVRADEAMQIGLANHVYPKDELLEQGLALARTIAAKGPLAVRLTKRAVQRGQDLDLENACILESQLFALCFSSADQKEGMAAFVEKRPARFQGQ
ncbi:MAG: enoyl-CoA hydratase-related protein [Burkholderiales bacterium]|nr:enoyl-CoA hydratase/isomerase family protein [Burkholderiales bacterium]MDQ3196985.1 enoyl-CoA hydratase-related protein [Pseudomonadota bacterium]